MKIEFVSPHPEFLDVIKAAGHPDISTRVGLLPFGIKCDAIVASANSYGWMGGGLDLVYRNEFGFELQWAAQRLINEQHPQGFIPVGECLSVPTNSPTIPNVIFAPTMKQPGPIIDVRTLERVYLAAFTLARDYGYYSIAVPDLGTRTGCVPHALSACMALDAYARFMQ